MVVTAPKNQMENIPTDIQSQIERTQRLGETAPPITTNPDRMGGSVSHLILDFDGNINLAAPGQISEQPHVDLIQADQRSLRAGIFNRTIYVSDGYLHIGHSFAMFDAGAKEQQKYLISL